MSYKRGLTVLWLGAVGFATLIGVADATRLLQCAGVILLEDEAALFGTEASSEETSP